MSSLHANTAIDGFLEAEGRLGRFLQAVPLAPEHNAVHSPVLASILLDTCSLLETTLKSSMDNSRYDSIPGIAAMRTRRSATKPPHLNINDLRTVFYPDGLYYKQVWHLSTGDKSVPFHVWRAHAGVGPTGHPSWWTAYNKVKHNRFENANKATLKTTLHSVKALFLVVLQNLDFRRRLVERGIIRSSALPTRTVLSATQHWEPLPQSSADAIVATTALFGYKFNSEGSRDRAADISLFL